MLARAKEEKEELDILLKVRALLATAESSEFEGEARSFRAKADSLAERYEIEPSLLAFPCEDLKVAVVMAELNRLKEIVAGLQGRGRDVGDQDRRVVSGPRRVRRRPRGGV